MCHAQLSGLGRTYAMSAPLHADLFVAYETAEAPLHSNDRAASQLKTCPMAAQFAKVALGQWLADKFTAERTFGGEYPPEMHCSLIGAPLLYGINLPVKAIFSSSPPSTRV